MFSCIISFNAQIEYWHWKELSFRNPQRNSKAFFLSSVFFVHSFFDWKKLSWQRLWYLASAAGRSMVVAMWHSTILTISSLRFSSCFSSFFDEWQCFTSTHYECLCWYPSSFWSHLPPHHKSGTPQLGQIYLSAVRWNEGRELQCYHHFNWH